MQNRSRGLRPAGHRTDSPEVQESAGRVNFGRWAAQEGVWRLFCASLACVEQVDDPECGKVLMQPA